MQWGPDADAKFFMHVLKIHNVKLDYNAVAIAMGNDVTPKALSHRIAKIRSMAENASAPNPGATSGDGLPQPKKRNPANRSPRVSAPPAPAGKKGAIGAVAGSGGGGGCKGPVVGMKRSAAGVGKGGDGDGDVGREIMDVIAACDDEGEGDGLAGHGNEDEADGTEMPAKKLKTTNADMWSGAQACFDETAEAGGEGDNGLDYA